MGVVYAAIYPIHKSGNWKPRGMTHMLALHSVITMKYELFIDSL